MGNLSSIWRRRDPPRPPDPLSQRFVKVTDSVWQLYPLPDSPSVTVPTIEVVFFHGLQVSNYEDAYWRTWRSRDETVVWPEAWLGPKIPGARILSVSYDSSAAKGKDGRPDPVGLAEDLEKELMRADVGQHCPVVLVGHSLGGIIIKRVILWMLQTRGHHRRYPKELENFLRNCKGVFYYSSPHGDSASADRVIRGFAFLQKANQVFERPVLFGLDALLLRYIVRVLWRASMELGDIRRYGVPLEQGVRVVVLMGLLVLPYFILNRPIVRRLRRLSSRTLDWARNARKWRRLGWRTVDWARNDRMKDVFAFLFLVFVLLGLALVGNILKYSTVSLNPKTAYRVMQVITLADWVLWTFVLLGLLTHSVDFVRRQSNSPIATLLTRLSTNTAILNREFTMAKHKIGDGGLRTRAIGESLPIIPWLPRVVELASAMQDVDGGFYTAPLANHFDVCKPKNNTTDPIFTYLLSFIDDLVPDLVKSAVVPEKVHPEVNQDNVPRGQVLESRPADIQMLSESVWQLYAPVSDPKVDVVFIHGLHEEPSNYEEAFWKTWLSRDGREIWPKDWLSQSLPEARILSISYVSIARSHPRWTKSSILGQNLIAENLIQDMFYARVGQNCPVVLVGHSVGGIILKKIVLECFRKKCLLSRPLYPREVDRVENFLRNCQGLFFYSTPFLGPSFGDYAQLILGIKDSLIPLLKTVDTLSEDSTRVNEEFSLIRNSENIATSTICEGVDTTYMGFTGRVVPKASARVDCDFLFSCSNADHFNVCKPKNRKDRTFRILAEFIESVVFGKIAPYDRFRKYWRET